MKHFSTYLVSATVLAALSLAQPALAADEKGASATKKTVATDFRGRPPFKRSRVSVDETAEFARFEQSDGQRNDKSKEWVVDTRGRPPFKRTAVSADEWADMARLEETDVPVKKQTRRGPPGKSTSQR